MAALLLSLGPGLLAVPAPAAAAAATDVTGQIAAGRDLRLTGDAVVRLTGGTLTYGGVITGEGTFTVTGRGTLVMARDSDFVLPPDRRRQKVVTYNGNHPLTRVDEPDPPAVVVERGATLQYGTGTGATGTISHDLAVPGFSWNTLNHRVDGTLDVAVHRQVHLGIMSGSGLITARRFTWPGLALAGDHPFSGTLFNGTAFDYGTNQYVTALPNVKTIVNQGSAIHGSPDGVTTIAPADYYSQSWGNDINYHTWGTGVVRNTGVYSWSDNGSVTRPALSDPALNHRVVAHRDNKRGINIEGANVEWGDGTDNRFFLPGNENTVYLNMHFDGRERSRLTLNYNGPVTLGAPISGGRYHDTLKAPGEGDVVIAATEGNAVTFTAPQNYNGSTTIGKDASLRLGDGTADGDSSLLRSTRYKIVNDGLLIVQNTTTAVTLSRISGAGGLTQAGGAPTTLAGDTTFRGPTTISKGTLKLTSGTLAASSAIDLTGAGAVLDLARAGDQTIRDLSGVAGTTVKLGGTLRLGTSASTTFHGALTGGAGLLKTGSGTLTLTGHSETPGTTWTVQDGTLGLTPTTSITANLSIGAGASLTGGGRLDGGLDNRGTIAGSGLAVSGDFRQHSDARLAATLAVAGTVTLAGAFDSTEAPIRDALSRAGDQPLTIIDNQGDNPVSGTFTGLPEGAAVEGRTLTYTGGEGNDVVLSAPTGGEGHGLLGGLSSGGGSAYAALVVLIVALPPAAVVLILLLLRRRPLRAARHQRHVHGSPAGGPGGSRRGSSPASRHEPD